MTSERPNSWTWNLGWLVAALMVGVCAFVMGRQQGLAEARDAASKQPAAAR